MWIAIRILIRRWHKRALISVTQIIMQMLLCQRILRSGCIRRTNGISYFLAWKTLVRYDGYVIVAFIDVRTRRWNLTLRAARIAFRCIRVISLPQLTHFIRAILTNTTVLRGISYKISCSTCLACILTCRRVFLSRFASAVAGIFRIVATVQCWNRFVLQ
jgi:hypothetical protein